MNKMKTSKYFQKMTKEEQKGFGTAIAAAAEGVVDTLSAAKNVIDTLSTAKGIIKNGIYYFS